MATLESPAAVSLVEAPAAPGGRPAVEVAHLRKSYGTLVAVAARRAAAAAVDRAGADRPAQDRGAGRDDHGPGPAGPAGHLGADRADPRPRRDDRPGHPLHGGSRTALRPRRPDRPRPRGRAGHPGPPGHPGPRREDHAVPAVRALRGPAADRAA